MRRLVLFLFAILSFVNVLAQSTQDGFVKEYKEKSRKTPLAGVQVLVANANRDVSGKAGDFHLQFRTLKPGDHVNVQNIIKSGYEIFNKEQLEVWRISNKNEPFTIVMCKSSMLKALKDEYNIIAYKSYEEQRKKELKQWQDMLKQGKIKEEEYEKQIAELCEYYDRKLDNLDTYIDRFARIDMSEISREERRIVELVRKGMIQEAIDEYNALKIDEELFRNYEEYEKVDAAISNLSRVSQKKHAYEEELLASLNNKFNLMMMQGSRQAIDDILSEYERLAEKCPHSVSILRSFVDFAGQEHDYRRVAKWGRILNEQIPEDMTLMKQHYCKLVADAENFMGNVAEANLYAERASEWINKAMQKDPSSAVHVFVASELDKMVELLLTENGLAQSISKAENLLEILDSLYTEFPTDEMRHTYLLSKYEIYSNYADSYIRLNDLAKVIEYNNRCIEYLDSLQMIENDDLVKSQRAVAYNNSAYYQILSQDYEGAEKSLQKAGEIAKEIYRRNPYKHYSVMFSNYTYYGLCYFYSGNVAKALEIYKEAVKFAAEIVESRPYPLFFTSYAELINNLGYISFSVGDYKTAEESFLQCIEKAKPFAENNPFKHLSPLVVAQINLGTLKLKQGYTDEFLAMQDTYWNNVEKLYSWQGIAFKVSYAIAWDNKGYHAYLSGNTDEALSIWKRIIDLEPNYLVYTPNSLLYSGLKESGVIE